MKRIKGKPLSVLSYMDLLIIEYDSKKSYIANMTLAVRQDFFTSLTQCRQRWRGEALQDIFLLSEGRNYLDLLPLHLCNLGIFVNLPAAFTRGKIRSFFAEISLVLIMPGAVSALLFPDWTYKPFWSYLPMLCFFTHTLLVFIPLVFLVRKTVRVSFKHFWYPFFFLNIKWIL